MKNTLLLCCALFATGTHLSAMEIEAVTKKSQEHTPLFKGKSQKESNDLSRTPLQVKDNSECWTYHISELPTEIRSIIYEKTFGIPQQGAHKLATFPTEKLLGYFFKAQQHCPFTVGNKTLVARDLLALTPTKRSELLGLSNRKYFEEDVNTIKTMPSYIQKDLQISASLPTCGKQLLENCLICSCCCGACIGGTAASIVPCVIGGCHASPAWWIPGGILLTFCVGLPMVGGIIDNPKICGCENKVVFQ